MRRCCALIADHRLARLVILAVVGALSAPADAAPPSSVPPGVTRRPLKQRPAVALFRAARMGEGAIKRTTIDHLKTLAALDGWIRELDPGPLREVATGEAINKLLAKIPAAGARRVDTTAKNGWILGERAANSDTWQGTLREVRKGVGSSSEVATRLAPRVSRITTELHQRMDARYRELPATLAALTDEKLVARATTLISILDHQAKGREASSQVVGSSSFSSSSSHVRVGLLSASSTSASASGSFTLSQLLPQGTAYSFNLTLPGFSSFEATPGILPVEARHIAQLGLELNAIARLLTSRQHHDAAPLSAWLSGSSIAFKTRDLTSLRDIASNLPNYGVKEVTKAQIQLARAPADLHNNQKELVRWGVISQQLAGNLSRDPVMRPGAGADF